MDKVYAVIGRERYGRDHQILATSSELVAIALAEDIRADRTHPIVKEYIRSRERGDPLKRYAKLPGVPGCTTQYECLVFDYFYIREVKFMESDET